MRFRRKRNMADTLRSDYFDRIYQARTDPWDFATSPYEREKYERTVASLTRDRYANAFEIGCSIGVLTHSLAAKCDHLLSVDVSEAALQQARERNSDSVNIEFQRLAVPEEYPHDAFDLTVVSEVGYYLSFEDLKTLAGHIHQHTKPEGQLLLVHWVPLVEDYPLTGDQVHEYFLSRPEWTCVTQFRATQYRIELLQLKTHAHHS